MAEAWARHLHGTRFDYVITVCDSARESCPVLRGSTRYLHAGFEDPPRLAAGVSGEEEALAPYRRIRDEIKEFVKGLSERPVRPVKGTDNTGDHQ